MNLRPLFSRKTINNVSRYNRILSGYGCYHGNRESAISPIAPSVDSLATHRSFFHALTPKYSKSHSFLTRFVHTAQEVIHSDSESETEDDATMNEFLSRFVWIMRGKLAEAYPDFDKKTIDGMLLIIVGKVVSEMEKGGLEKMLESAAANPSQDFSEDLWKTVWEVSNVVLDDMEKARRKEKLKGFLHAEEVKEMYRFAGEVGIRGDMLRELRFKWAREKMEENELYENLERLKQEEALAEGVASFPSLVEESAGSDVSVEENPNIISLPKRHGKIKYKIYGLDLSDPKWAEVANKIHETGEIIWPQEPKPISGKCKIVTEKILSMQEEEDPSPLLAEWVELLKPSRIDWITLLEKLKETNDRLYFKIAEHVLDEESFQANMRDYSKLVDAHAQENRLDDAERILKKMNSKGIVPDILTSTIMVHMYSKVGNLDRAKEAFDSLRSLGFQPDVRLYISMIMAYVNANQPKLGESLMREMEARDIKPSTEIYMALLRSFAQRGDVSGAQRIATTMQFAGIQPSLESCTLLVEAFGQAGDPDQARHNFDYMMKLGHKPDDRCTASMIAAYEKKNLLDKALNLLLQLEKDGFEPGVATYAVLVDWLGKLQLIDEAEQILDKISQLGEAPPLKVQISLCDMYAKARDDKKALQALGVLESKKEQLGAAEYDRIIKALIDGGFVQDARRIHGLMEAQGISVGEPLKVAFMASQAFRGKNQTLR